MPRAGVAPLGARAEPGRGQVQRALHGQLGRVQREPGVRVDQPRPAQAQRHPDLGAAQAELAVGLQQFGLEVLADAQAVTGDRAAGAVLVHHGLVQHQVGADVRVGQPDPAQEPAARQVQVALGLHPGGLQPRHRAVHQPHRRQPGLRQQHVPLEPAAPHLHVRHHRAARQIQGAAQPHPGQLQRGHPPGQRRRAVQQQPGHDAGPHGALRAPRLPAVRVVHQCVPAAQVVHAAVAEGLPHPGLDGGQVVRQVPRAPAAPLVHHPATSVPRGTSRSSHTCSCPLGDEPTTESEEYLRNVTGCPSRGPWTFCISH